MVVEHHAAQGRHLQHHGAGGGHRGSVRHGHQRRHGHIRLIYGDADPTIQLDAPASNSTFTTFISAAGRAFDDTGVGRVEVQVRDAQGRYLTSAGTFTTAVTWVVAFTTNPGGLSSNWYYASPTLPAGVYSVSARVRDVKGQYLQAPPIRTNVTVVP